MTNPIDPFIRSFGNTAVKLPLADLPWLADIRNEARDSYQTLGLPTPRLERWKYTNLKALNNYDFCQTEPAAANDSQTINDLLGNIDSYKLVIVNGQVDASLSDISSLPVGVSLTGLATAIEENPENLAKKIGALADKNDALTALNGAYLADGVYLHVSENVILDKPIHLIFFATGNQEAIAFHPRNLIQMDAGAKADIIESHTGVIGNTFANSLSEIWVDEGAELGHYKLQNEHGDAYHVANSFVQVAEKAIYNNFTLQLGGKLARNEVNCTIIGSHAEAHVNGAYFGNGDQHIDNTSFIDHAVPQSNSFETFKGVLDDKATAVFQGKILVRKDAQQTDGQQMNRALLLSRKAEVNAKPELEIYADDVKCSHGATIGELDETQLFYLMTRGIDEPTARNLLVQAFLFEVLEKIPHAEIKQSFHDVIADKLEDLS